MTSIKAQREEFDTKPDVGINQDAESLLMFLLEPKSHWLK